MVREFVKDRTGIDGRIGTNLLASLAKFTGFYVDPWVRALQVGVGVGRARAAWGSRADPTANNTLAATTRWPAARCPLRPARSHCCRHLPPNLRRAASLPPRTART
jgi:hypothetical protein